MESQSDSREAIQAIREQVFVNDKNSLQLYGLREL
jgi:hypothetical protein